MSWDRRACSPMRQRGFPSSGCSTRIRRRSVLSLVPVLGVTLLRKGSVLASSTASDSGVEALRRFCDWVALRMVRRPGLNTAIGLFVVAVLGVAYFGLHPSWRL